MKKMIMMMVAASTLALGARATTTVEWGLTGEGGSGINNFFEGRWAYMPEESAGTAWPQISRAYIYVVAADDIVMAEGYFNHSDTYYSLEAQLNAGTFDGTDPSIMGCVVLSSPFEGAWYGGWQSPTFLTDIPDGMSFGLLFVGELMEPLDGCYWANPEGKAFVYWGLYGGEWSGWYEDGVRYFNFPGDDYLRFADLTLAYPVIPEPATGLLALAGIALLIRRKRK